MDTIFEVLRETLEQANPSTGRRENAQTDRLVLAIAEYVNTTYLAADTGLEALAGLLNDAAARLSGYAIPRAR